MPAAQVTPMGQFVVIAMPASSWRTVKTALTATEVYSLAVWLDATTAFCLGESTVVRSTDVAEFFRVPTSPTMFEPNLPTPTSVGVTLARNNADLTASTLCVAIADAHNRTASAALDMTETAALATALYAAAVAACPPKELVS